MKSIIMIVLIAILTGCGEQNVGDKTTSTGDILANEMIQKDASADFFILNDRVYVRKEEIQDGTDKLGELVGSIESNYSTEGKFKNLMSTRLSIGTEIYRFKNKNTTDQVIAKENDKLIIYEALSEG
ncbi:hypothetical protein OIN60_08325 [Paenibacillus sp. P96]|uniref:Uncharacterized protein n=1 Tax=Paenibacillus zeirhizosphaerae TaxID=2987519 RepID=A0ABT9FQR7_9BACL|nr:hypothetical protein [Paenibacillus sp. P96]MDP4096777.1 hypothetical protein [Paenibacillus sp. P96]